VPEACLTSDKFNEDTDCVMLGHMYCEQMCCDPDICILCGFDREA
jgi:hypothetical protein